MSYDFHDATLSLLEINWQERKCKILVTAWKKLITVECDGVSCVKVPMESPWGRSKSINSFDARGNHLSIQMQSGDLILVLFNKIFYSHVDLDRSE